MHEDRTAALRAVDDAHAIDARRVALEVAGAVVTSVRACRAGRAIRIAVGQIDAPIRECARSLGSTGRSLSPEVVAVGGDPDAAAEDRDAGAFIRAHQGRFLQHLRQVAVAGSIPADEAFERDAVGTHEHAGWAGVRARRIETAIVQVRCTIYRQTEQAVDLTAPWIQLANRVGVGVDGDRSRTHTLQSHGLPHHQQFLVGARADDDQIARGRVVDGGLQRVGERLSEQPTACARRRHISRRLAGHGDGDGVNRFLAVRCRDNQFAATIVCRSRAAHAALRRRLACWYGRRGAAIAGGADTGRGIQRRRYCRHRNGDRGVAPGIYRCIDPGDGDGSGCRAEAVVPRDGLLVIRRCSRIGSGEGGVLHRFVAQ